MFYSHKRRPSLPPHHEHLADIARETMYSWIPVIVGILLQRTKHNWQHCLPVLCYQSDDVFMVPQKQAALGYLQIVSTGNHMASAMTGQIGSDT